MKTFYKGGCQCGAIRYEADAEPAFSIRCYCRQCQQITGTGHAVSFAMPASSVRLTGTLSTYELKADNGNRVESRFCPTCGSPVMKRTDGHPQWIFFHAATLDDPTVFTPGKSVYEESRQPWDFEPGQNQSEASGDI